jgi:FdhD protein
MRILHTPPSEILAQIVVDDEPVVQFLCSPRDLQALAYGWLFTQGVINAPSDISSLRACHESGMIHVSLRVPGRDRFVGFRTALSSGCGGGLVNLEQYLSALPEITSNFAADHATLERIMSEMYESFRASSRWEGMHCAALARTHVSEELIVASDIGRHNAVDKVIGHGFVRDWDFATSALATSGRLSSDMVLKAHRAGISIIISQHSVTTLAIEIARAARISLVSRFGRRDEEVFGEVGRIVNAAAHA